MIMIELKHSTFLLVAVAVCSTPAVFAASIPGYPNRPIRLLLPCQQPPTTQCAKTTESQRACQVPFQSAK